MNNSPKGLPLIVYLAGFLAITSSGCTFASNKQSTLPRPVTVESQPSYIDESSEQVEETKSGFMVPKTVPAKTVIKIGGSTSMVVINQSLKVGFEKKFPDATVFSTPSSSGKGLTDILAGKIDIAAVSHELTDEEKGQGLVAVPITQDQIAIVVGIGNENIAEDGLTSQQVNKIFTGEFDNWSKIEGGKPLPIRPILRPATSGTHQSFQEIGLQGNFGTGKNFKVLDRDGTTPLLQSLGVDGIGYAPFSQVDNQSTVKWLKIDGTTPDSEDYPYRRKLAYVYKNKPSAAVQAFLGFATSSEGEELITPQSSNQ
jgi:phosphate transport system substrate-binding protein